MYLYELSNDEKLNSILFAVDNLKQDLNSGKIVHNWTLKDLQDYFSKNDVILSTDDLRTMSQLEPLKDIITNIAGQEVVFKGLPQQKTPKPGSPEQSQEVVKKMAQHALNK